jgi:hypothetical protein
MRRSRVVFTGIAVAAAAVAGTAFTAQNTVPNSVAGYGQSTVTGVVVSNIQYTPLAADNTYLDTVVFTTSTDVTNAAYTATMTLKNGGSPLGSGLGGPYSCTKSAYSTTMTLTCAVSASTVKLNDFDAVGLTVRQ